MPELLRYHDLELPVFDSDTTLACPENGLIYRHAAEDASPDGRFVRLARIRAYGESSLKKVLKLAAADMEWFCDELDGEVIDHQFGLMPLSEDRPALTAYYKRGNEEHPELVPRGMLLVAEVDVVTEITEINNTQSIKYLLAEKKYHNNRLRHRIGSYWADYQTPQFKNCYHNPSDSWGLRLLDVEPIMAVAK